MNEKTQEVVFSIFRSGAYVTYRLSVVEGMTVLDAVLDIQAKFAPDLGVRCNCTAGKCGSCSAEINGVSRLMCKTRIGDLPQDRPIVVGPLKSFEGIKDLVTDVSWNYETNRRIPPLAVGDRAKSRMYQFEVDRIQELRKCIECFLCQNTCHVLREHDKKKEYFGPRFFVRLAALAMHPFDQVQRMSFIKKEAGVGLCNITRCCSDVCPEKIKITDNAIIPLKERVADTFYDPLLVLFRKMFSKNKDSER